MKVKNVLLIIGFLIVSSCLVMLIHLNMNKKFYLDEEYYEVSKMKDMENSRLKMMIYNDSSFVLFIANNTDESKEFENMLKEFQNENQISFYKTYYENIDMTLLEKDIKGYPAILIFKKGNVIAYLDYEVDFKSKIYKSKEEFSEWFTKYVELKEVSGDITTTTTTTTSTTTTTDLKSVKVNLPDVKREKGKVNIYIFWGSGCPHCEAAFEFFDEIEAEYKKKYNLYKFEVWRNDENRNIMKVFAYEMENKSVSGVPYIIIGSKSFRGFSSATIDRIKSAIDEESKGDFDIYFDVIKDKYKG